MGDRERTISEHLTPEKKAETAQKMAEAAQRKAEEAQRKAEAAEKKAEAQEKRAEVAQKKSEEAQKRAEAAEKRAAAAERRAEAAEKRAEDAVKKVPQKKHELEKAELWKHIISRKKGGFESGVLEITRPTAKLDPIAHEALEELVKEAGIRKIEKKVLSTITKEGIASEVSKVTQRLNARRMSPGRRWMLSATYVALLAELIEGTEEKKLEKLMEDDLGVAEKIMLELEKNGGFLDDFAERITKKMTKRKNIDLDDTKQAIVTQRIRSAI